MRRRTLLGSLAALGAVPSSLSAAPAQQMAASSPRGKLKIAALEMWRLEGQRETTSGVSGQHQVQPLHVYEDHRPKEYRDAQSPTRRTVTSRALYLRIKTDGGLDGLYGPIDSEAAVVVDRQLSGFLKGKDPLAVEALWDQMHRSNRHASRGHYMMAISAVDNALWDLRGRYYQAPVYQLLGGPTRSSVTAYGSCLGYSVEPEAAARRALQLKEEGYRHQKWFLAYGPGDGAAGMAKNVALVRALRESVGPEVDLMFDAFMGWDYNYALQWAKQVEAYQPRWIEEAFPPEKIESFAELRRGTSIPVASGEHFYNRWQTAEYLKAGAISVVQADPEWCGGVSELVKICTLASLYDAHVIPHGHSVHAALHVVASQSPMTCPMVEYLINKMRTYYEFEKQPPRPVNGAMPLPTGPGFGIEFDPAKVLKQELARFS
jgi:L-rhamnonate dehydratase